MAKFCTNCGNQLNDNASMCLNCGYMVGGTNNPSSNNLNNSGNTKKKGLPTWAIVLIIVGCIILVPILIVVAVIIFGFNVVKDQIDDFDNLTEEQEYIGTINDTLVSDDLRITLNDALMYSSIGDEYFTNTPAEGKEYLVFFFEIENLDDENMLISNYDFDGYADGYSISTEYIFGDINGVESLNKTLAPGMKTTGYVAFEVDTTWNNFEIRYEELDLDLNDADDKFIFKVKNSDDTTGV